MMKLEEKVRAIFNKHRIQGMTFGLFDRHNLIEAGYYGYASQEKDLKTNDQTIYRIASISKVIVAIGALMLVDQQLLDLDCDISSYLGFPLKNPKYPDIPITVRMLMTQTSSINDGNYQETSGYNFANLNNSEVRLEDLLNNPNSPYYTSDSFGDYPPGTKWVYSNFGCGILACIIEKITGEYFSRYIRRVLLIPMNIDASFRVEDIIQKDQVATLYNFVDNQFIMTRDLDAFIAKKFPYYEIGHNFRGPAGGLFIKMLDLAKIMQMLMNNGLYDNHRYLSEAIITEMEKVQVDNIKTDSVYRKKGLQLLLLDGYGPTVLRGHFGSAYGLRSFMLYNDDIGMLFLCNGADFREVNHLAIIQDEMIKLMIDYTLSLK